MHVCSLLKNKTLQKTTKKPSKHSRKIIGAALGKGSSHARLMTTIDLICLAVRFYLPGKLCYIWIGAGTVEGEKRECVPSPYYK